MREIVEKNAAAESPVLKHDFFRPLLAAFTPREVKEQLRESGLKNLRVKMASERHWLAWGRI